MKSGMNDEHVLNYNNYVVLECTIINFKLTIISRIKWEFKSSLRTRCNDVQIWVVDRLTGFDLHTVLMWPYKDMNSLA